jgi:hypothetical protein
LDGFGKIQEFVPLGAEIEQGENQNASYSQIKNKVKYVWMSMPKSESFKVSYYIDLSNADSKDVKSITGNFSYLDNDVTKKLNVVWADESEMMAQASSSNQNNQEASNGENSEEKQSDESEIPTNNSTSNSSPKPNSETVAVVPVVPIKNDNSMEDSNDAQNEGNADDTNLALNESSANNENDEVEEQNTNEVSAPLEIPSENANNEIEEITAQNESNDETTLASNESTRTEVESSSDENEEKMGLSENSSSEIAQVAKDNTGVRYRVQIAAGKNIVNAAYFQKKHQFESEFNVENHQGWVKYTTGSFGLYKDARDSREVINSAGHNFDGPFVTAYNQGQRITVQEALMITSQKWYK